MSMSWQRGHNKLRTAFSDTITNNNIMTEACVAVEILFCNIVYIEGIIFQWKWFSIHQNKKSKKEDKWKYKVLVYNTSLSDKNEMK